MAKLSKTKIFSLILLAFIIGIGAASFIKFDNLIIYFVILISLLIFLLSSGRSLKIIAILFFFFILGVLRYQLSYPKIDESKIQFYNGQKILFQGLINTEPDVRSDKILLTVKAEKINNQKISGKVLVPAPLYSPYQYGQILEIECKLEEPENFGRFDYHEYLARYDIYSICRYPKIKILAEGRGNFVYSQILKLKAMAKNLIDNYLTEPQSALLSALLLGLRRDFSPEVIDWFRRTGASHIIAISGLHVLVMIQIIESLFFSVFGLSRRSAFYFTVIFVIFFVILTGGAASAIRAGIMGILLLYAKKIGRLSQPLNAILLAGALMLFFNPKLLRWDVGFQLSFLAIFGLIYLTPYFYFLFKKLPDWKKWSIRLNLSMTCGAYLFTLPLILYYFGNLSLSAFLANILILGLLSRLMLFGFIFIIGGLIWSFFATILVWPVWLLLTYFLLIIKFLASIPFLSFSLGLIHWSLVFLLYFLLTLVIIKLHRKYKFIFDNF
jgi:competence protein ComEC